MTEAVSRLIPELQQLSPSEQAEVIEFLVANLPPPPDDDWSEEEFDAELARREKSIDEGTADLRPAFEVLDEMLRKYP